MKPYSILVFGTIVSLLLGGTIGFVSGRLSNQRPDKPIEVCISDENHNYLHYMDADSVVGNKAYNDGLQIQLNNIWYVKFK